MAVEQEQAPPPVAAEEPSVEERSIEEVPVLAVRDTVIFPGALLPITVGRPSSVALVQSLGENRTLAVIAQLDPRVDTPGPDDMYEIGTVCVMHKAIRVPKDNLLLFCEGIARIRTRRVHRDGAVPARAGGAHPRCRARDHAGDRSAAAERAQPVSADRRGDAESLGRPVDHRGADHRTRPAGRFRGGQRALADRLRAPAPARRSWTATRASPKCIAT